MFLTQRLLDHYLKQQALYEDDSEALEYINAKINALTTMLIEYHFD